MRLLRASWPQQIRSLSSTIPRKSSLLDSSKYEYKFKKQDDSTITQETNETSDNVLRKRRSVDAKSRRQQRQSLPRSFETEQNKPHKQGTDARSARLDEPEYLSNAGDIRSSHQKQDSQYDNAKPHVSPTLPHKKDRWRNRVSKPIDDSAEDNPKNPSQPRKDLTGQQSRRSIADMPDWKIHKEAVKAKLGGQTWNPLKKLSPDAREGVRQLHSEDPKLWSTENLASHFEISPDAIRRILKSNWTPTDKEREEQQERWVRRGEAIWDRYVELGYKAPRKWRGLNPMPAPKRPTARGNSEFKPEEWSQDQIIENEEDNDPRPSLGNRIM